MHGMMKMAEFIKLFGSGINFYGGPEESHYKYFVKAPGNLAQRRVSEFAKQVANSVYETMTFEVANEGFRLENTKWRISQEEDSDGSSDINPTICANYDNSDYVCLGAYSVSIFPLKKDSSPNYRPARWDGHDAQKLGRPEYKLHPRLLKILSREVTKRYLTVNEVRGYTEVKANIGDQSHIF